MVSFALHRLISAWYPRKSDTQKRIHPHPSPSSPADITLLSPRETHDYTLIFAFYDATRSLDSESAFLFNVLFHGVSRKQAHKYLRDLIVGPRFPPQRPVYVNLLAGFFAFLEPPPLTLLQIIEEGAGPFFFFWDSVLRPSVILCLMLFLSAREGSVCMPACLSAN